MLLTDVNDLDDLNEPEAAIIARIEERLQKSTSKPDPAYLAQVELIYANRTVYPYADGRKDLAEYIELRKNNWAGRYCTALWNKLKRYKIIPDDIAIHAAKVAEENAKKREALQNGDNTPKQEALIERVGARGKIVSFFRRIRGE